MTKIKLLVLIISLAAMFSIYQYVFADVPSGSLLEDHSLSSKVSLSSGSALNKMVYLPAQPFSEQDAEAMVNHLNQVHPVILEKARQHNVTIKLFTGKLTDEEGLEHLSGQTPRGYSIKSDWDRVPGMTEDNRVFVKIGHSQYGMGHGSVSLELHEFAHAADRNVFSNIRNNPFYLNIWKQEAGLLFPGKTYFERFPEEYFAEIFAMYYLNEKTRGELRENAPLSYRFISKLHKTVENE
ncbi:anthrax toxin lethal factor-related metalloendopeptidase [Peribacillus frigoritolerans]|uniref:anthrax toxin lethal factor-related metalloendopeptidase n=1 Tax=Peribacillus frigoritolerans TaxID=450367 RepID=UPI001059B6E6|nr:toxin [Peribacillus frigoritolerans]TDL82681.1 toxin [Peribacillus frigoritolerans]